MSPTPAPTPTPTSSECDDLRAQVEAAQRERDAAVKAFQDATTAWDRDLKNRRKAEAKYTKALETARSYGATLMQTTAEYADAKDEEARTYQLWFDAPIDDREKELADYAEAIEQFQKAHRRWEQANERYGMYEEEVKALYDQLGPAQQAERASHAALGEAADRLNAADEQLQFVSKEFRDKCPDAGAGDNAGDAGAPGATSGAPPPGAEPREPAGIEVVLGVSWKNIAQRYDSSIPATFYTLQFTVKIPVDDRVSGPDPAFGPGAPSSQPGYRELQWTREAKVEGSRSHYGCTGSGEVRIPATIYVGITEADIRSRAEAQCTWCGPWGTPELL